MEHHTVLALMYDLRELAEAKRTNQKMRVIIPIERQIPTDADGVLDSCQAHLTAIRGELPLAVFLAAFDDLAHARHLVSSQTEGR